MGLASATWLSDGSFETSGSVLPGPIKAVFDTVTVELQVVVLSFASVAVHVMVVVPILSNFPASEVLAASNTDTVAPLKLYAKEGVPQLSDAVASNSWPRTEYLDEFLFADRVAFGTHAIVGGVLSTTVTRNILEIDPHELEAVTNTGVVPL